MMDFTKPTAFSASQQTATYDANLRAFMIKIFNYMAIALTMTGAVAYFTAESSFMMSLFYSTNPMGQVTGISGLGYLIMFAPLIFVFLFGMSISRVSVNTAQLMFWAFSIIMGLSLSQIFLIYTGESITRVFFITAAIFAAMSIYGYTTKRSLVAMGSFLFMGLIGVIIASLVNMFMQSPAIYFATSVLSVLIFTGLTAYDVQKMVAIYHAYPNSEEKDKAAIMGALSLYMDFLNIFLSLLRLFGNRRS